MIRYLPRVLLAGSLGVGLLIAGCSPATTAVNVAAQPAAAAEAAAPVPVQVARAKRGAITETLSYAGDVEPRRQVTIVSRLPALVETILVDVGSVVRAGDVLIELDKAALQAQLWQAEAARNGAAAKLAGMKAAPRAATQTRAAPSPFTENDIAAAQAAVDQANAAVELARIQLSQATIKAPFDGVVAQRLVAEGALAGPATPLLRLISRDSQVSINVDEARLGDLQSGQLATIAIATYPQRTFEATVATIAPSIDPKTRTVQVKLMPQEGEGNLRDGMFAQVQVQLGGKENALLVPRAAVTQAGATATVFVIDSGTVHPRAVATGLADGELIEILQGLDEGEVVVTSGLSNLKDGQEVSVE